MEAYQDIINTIALTLGASWASGINLYAAIAMLGLMGMSGTAPLPPDLQILTEPVVIGAAGLMYVVEFFADKFPGVDTGWDTIHTFIRIPAGALLAYGAAAEVSPALAVAAAIVGGSITAGTHAAKAGARVIINTSPEPFTNWFASIGEDVAVFAGIWTAIHHPVLFLVLLALFLVMLIWLLPKIWRGIRKIFGFIAERFRGASRPPAPPCETAPPAIAPPSIGHTDESAAGGNNR